ncbi:MAG: aquaporin [Dehalococcoidia bacterium]|nr:aquaporin [Dehalococcoidia bacterium]MSQ36576.1 aquaporin [Dehalococcoidia bacterium]
MNTQLARRLTAEFIGTFALIFIGAGAIITGAGLIGVALAHGLAIAIMITAFGRVSGGHFNPAVTIGVWATRRIASLDAAAYIVVQLLAGIAGALALLMFPETLRDVANGVPALSGVDFMQGVAIEIVLTFFLVIAIFGTAVDRHAPQVGGFAIGLTITMDIFAGGRLTGAAMNPARAFGPALVNGAWDDHLVWWIGPIIGAVLAALLYHYVFFDDEQRAEVLAS